MGLASFLSGFFTRPTAPAKLTEPAGSDGVWAPGGFLVGGESHRDLQGQSKWRTYDNTLASSLTVAAMARIWGALLGGSKWVVEANPRGGAKAELAADLVREGLIDAQMSTPWNSVVRKAGFGSKFRGFAMFEQVLRRRADGRWITDRLEHRPQHTIEQWDKPDEQQPWRGVVQRTASGSTFYIQRERLLYVVDDLLGDAPDGVGILRHAADPSTKIARLEQLEGWGFEFSLHGVPMAFVPIKALAAEAVASGVPSNDKAAIKAYIDERIAFVDTFLRKHAKNPELSIALDSETYVTGDEKRAPSDVRKWDIKTMSVTASGQAEVRGAITARDRQIMRLLGFEFLAMGDSEGARSVHEDKTKIAGMILNGTLEDIGAAATLGPARRLVTLNGIDADTCAPRVYAEPVPTETIEGACNALAALARAGDPLQPDDEAPDAIRERMRLPRRPNRDPGMLPRALPIGGPPDPVKGEVDVSIGAGDPPPATSVKATKRAPKYKLGARVTALVNHMEGMKGMSGKVKIARGGSPPYYGVRFDDQDAMPGTHKWLAEDEIEPVSDKTEAM